MSGPAAEQLLADALDYSERGFRIVPMLSTKGPDGRGIKRPLMRYARIAQHGQSTDEVRQLFGPRSKANGLAIIMGQQTRPGRVLATRDFDTEEGYARFADRLPAFARSVPTSQTHRGKHIYFESDHPQIVKLADGEFRGAGLVLAPRSEHYAGGRYEWIRPLTAELPFIESSKLIERKVTHDVTETAECHCSVLSAVSVLSVTSADEVVRVTLPTKPGERNACLLNLARGLKLNMGIRDMAMLRSLVKQWHARALPFIETKDAGVSWADFLHAYERAHHPLGVDLVDAAAMQVDPEHLPVIAGNYDGDATRQLIGLCHALAKLNGDSGRFFLSTHDAAPRLRLTPMQVWRLLRVLEADKVIERVETGNERRATRYRWIGGAAGEVVER